jgi:hypothetical protein
MADRQAEIPQRVQKRMEKTLVGRADRPGKQDQDVDVRMKAQLAPAVTAEGEDTNRLRKRARFREELLDHRVHPVGVLSQRLASARAALGCRDKLRPGGLDALTPQGPWIGRCVNR